MTVKQMAKFNVFFNSNLILFLLLFSIYSPVLAGTGKPGKGTEKKWKILHIMSYHSPWKWTDDQFDGFRHVLKDLDIEYKVFQMDTKRKDSKEWKIEAGRQARELIDSWKPDLVYTNDDNAQEYVTKFYINSEIPFVFSGVNREPGDYGFAGSKNVTGVLEREHFTQTVHLLKEIVPDIKKIAVIFDEGPTWDGVMKRMKMKIGQNQLPGVEFVSWETIKTFTEYKEKITELQTKADAIALLGIFTFKDESGGNVAYTEILKWTAQNSNLPDFSFWKTRIESGTLCAVTVSGFEQGMAAGKIAKGILADGKRPADYPMTPTVKGEPVVSLARAKKLGINIKSGILLTAEVVKTFKWEE